VTREELERLTGQVARALDAALKEDAGERVGFVLLLFDFEPGGWFTYGSNGTRADVVRLLKEAREKIGAESQ
jgi:hypothetical protein